MIHSIDILPVHMSGVMGGRYPDVALDLDITGAALVNVQPTERKVEQYVE